MCSSPLLGALLTPLLLPLHVTQAHREGGVGECMGHWDAIWETGSTTGIFPILSKSHSFLPPTLPHLNSSICLPGRLQQCTKIPELPSSPYEL